jgi:hypothetical protein
MLFLDILIFLALVAGCVIAYNEIKVYAQARQTKEKKPDAGRLARRFAGGMLLLGALFLLRFSCAYHIADPRLMLAGVALSLIMTVMAFAIAIRDFRAIAAEGQKEAHDLTEKSAQELRQYFAAAAPESQQKLQPHSPTTPEEGSEGSDGS